MAKLTSKKVPHGRFVYMKGLDRWNLSEKFSPRSPRARIYKEDAIEYFKKAWVQHDFQPAGRALAFCVLSDIDGKLDHNSTVSLVERTAVLMSVYFNKLLTIPVYRRVIEDQFGPFTAKLDDTEVYPLICLLISQDFNPTPDFISVNSTCFTSNIPNFEIKPSIPLADLFNQEAFNHNSSFVTLVGAAAINMSLKHRHCRADKKEKLQKIADFKGHPETLYSFSLMCLYDYVVFRKTGGDSVKAAEQEELALKYMMQFLRVVRSEEYPLVSSIQKYISTFPVITAPFVNSSVNPMYRGFATLLIALEFKKRPNRLLEKPFLKIPAFSLRDSDLVYNISDFYVPWLLRALDDKDRRTVKWIKYAARVLKDPDAIGLLPSVRKTKIKKIVSRAI